MLEKINNNKIKSFYLNKLNEILNNNTFINVIKKRKIRNIKAKINLSNVFLIKKELDNNTIKILDSLKFSDYLYDGKEFPILIFLYNEGNYYYFIKTEYLNEEGDIIIESINKESKVYLKIEKKHFELYDNLIINDYHINDIKEIKTPIKIFKEYFTNFENDKKNVTNFFREDRNFLVGMVTEYNYDEIIEDEIIEDNRDKLKDEIREIIKMISSDVFKLGYYDLGKLCMKTINKIEQNEFK